MAKVFWLRLALLLRPLLIVRIMAEALWLKLALLSRPLPIVWMRTAVLKVKLATRFRKTDQAQPRADESSGKTAGRASTWAGSCSVAATRTAPRATRT